MGALASFNLAGKKAFITGGSRGIGRAVALAFADAGADTAIVDADLEAASAVADELVSRGARSFAVRADVSDPGDVDRMVAAVLGRFGSLDIAFNNAEIRDDGKAEDLDFERWKRVIDINLTGVFLTSRAAGRAMIRGGGGSIINTASMSGHVVNVPRPQCAYNASKAAVIMLTKSLAVEWAPYNVRVNSVSPGYIGPEMAYDAAACLSEREFLTPMNRAGKPEELTAAIVYLAGYGASFATGADLVIDGAFACA